MADMGKTETAATIQELVSTIIQEQLIENSKLVATVDDRSSEVKPGMDTLKISRAGNFSVDSKAENTPLVTQIITYATDDLALDQYKAIQVRLEDNASLQSNVNVVSDVIGRMGRQLALDIDTYLVTQLEATSAAAPDHRVAYAGTAIAQEDILTARQLLMEQNIDFGECFLGINPESEKAILSIADFVRADAYGSPAGLVNGEVGKLYGCRVVVSNEFATLKSLVWHPSHVAFARQMMPKFETDRDLPNLADVYSLSHLYGAITLDSGVRGVMLGTAT